MHLNPLRVGLIGAGNIAHAHVPGFKHAPNVVQLAAVADVSREASSRIADQFDNKIFIAESAEDLISRNDIDAVDICTPHDQHFELACAAAAAGKHILLEKPMACSLEDCIRIAEVCEQAKVVLMVGQNLRYVPSYRSVKALIDGGSLGRIWGGQIEEFFAFDSTRRPRAHPTWYTDATRAGGGVLITQTTHHIDLFRYFLGEIDRVCAHIVAEHPGYSGGAEDCAIATMVFKNGAHVQIRASNSARLERIGFSILANEGVIFTEIPSNTSAALKHRAPAYASVSSQGPVTYSGTTGAAQVPDAIPLLSEATLPSDDPFINEILHFAECCRNNLVPLSSGRDNIETMKSVFALYRSARSNSSWVSPNDI